MQHKLIAFPLAHRQRLHSLRSISGTTKRKLKYDTFLNQGSRIRYHFAVFTPHDWPTKGSAPKLIGFTPLMDQVRPTNVPLSQVHLRNYETKTQIWCISESSITNRIWFCHHQPRTADQQKAVRQNLNKKLHSCRTFQATEILDAQLFVGQPCLVTAKSYVIFMPDSAMSYLSSFRSSRDRLERLEPFVGVTWFINVVKSMSLWYRALCWPAVSAKKITKEYRNLNAWFRDALSLSFRLIDSRDCIVRCRYSISKG